MLHHAIAVGARLWKRNSHAKQSRGDHAILRVVFQITHIVHIDLARRKAHRIHRLGAVRQMLGVILCREEHALQILGAIHINILARPLRSCALQAGVVMSNPAV